MAQIKAFQAIRFSENDITNFICPPYDVISSDEKERLKKLSPFNIVNVELSDSLGKKNKYENAADLFKLWQDEGVLVYDEKPALYFYEQVFDDHGIKMTRVGFFAALKLDDPHSDKSSIKPHEKTLIKPKGDRLELLKATKANISPIFCLFEDEDFIIKDICKKVCRKIPSATAKDKDGTFHKLWIVNDEYVIETIEQYLLSKKMFIADGHHRYETAWDYSQEIKEKDEDYSLQKDYNYVLTYFCPMEDQGISIWPTHRVIEEPVELESNIAKYFDVYSAKDFQKLSKKEIQPIMVFKNGKYRVLTIKKDSLLKKIMPNSSKAYRNLAVSILHSVLIPNSDASEFIYVKNDKEAVLLAQKTGKIAIIVPPTPVESLKAISLNNEMMPQKSTYFYPKIASGVVMRIISSY
ncbi:MAG: DUF1015 domain-containing protein [Endomicrobiia bacterium]|nr:MAG: DUF1015 domain-containing protein [Endomicrobiia bacterium]